MFAAIPLFSTIATYVGEWFKGKQVIQAAVIENTARQIRDTETNNSAWEMANLTDKDKWLRRVSFAMFSAPMVWALFDPDGVREYFTIALAAMPEWYIQMYAAMVGGIWGIAALKNAVPGLVGSIASALRTPVAPWVDPDK